MNEPRPPTGRGSTQTGTLTRYLVSADTAAQASRRLRRLLRLGSKIGTIALRHGIATHGERLKKLRPFATVTRQEQSSKIPSILPIPSRPSRSAPSLCRTGRLPVCSVGPLRGSFFAGSPAE